MIERVLVRRGTFLDSVALMLLSRDVGRLDGVEQASVVNATPLNRELVAGLGFAIPAGGDDEPEPGPNDLLIAIRARGEEELAAALSLVEERLRRRAPREGAAERPPPRSLTAAARRRDDLNLVLISVPGPHAAYECARALDAGLDVFCFSSGPGVEIEAALKQRANALGLLMMGPDCGTAIINGIAIGFGNAVEPGPVGIVGASGTGIQAIACRLDAAGIGISQAIGTGGRDLSAPVGGAMTLRGIELLGDDPETEAIVVVAKSPDPAVAARVADAAEATGKPAVLALPGFEDEEIAFVTSLEEAAAAAARSLGVELPSPQRLGARSATPGAIRGLFSGGTLRDEALAVITANGAEVGTDLERPPADGHVLADLGDERLTAGRPHPMIDLTLRTSLLAEQAADPGVGVLLLDVVLGYGAHPDPAGELGAAISAALARREGNLSVIVSVCGTARDPQGTERQAARIAEAGALVTSANADAARLAVEAAGLREVAR